MLTWANSLLVERAQIVPLGNLTDVVAGAFTGDFINLANFQRCSLVFFKEPGAAGEDPVYTLLQATSNGGATKALVPKRVHSKQAATDLTAVARFSDVAATDISTNTVTNATLAEQVAVHVVDILPEDLDVDNGYSWIQVTIADVGTTGAQWIAPLAILEGPRNGGNIDDMPSAIA